MAPSETVNGQVVALFRSFKVGRRQQTHDTTQTHFIHLDLLETISTHSDH